MTSSSTTSKKRSRPSSRRTPKTPTTPTGTRTSTTTTRDEGEDEDDGEEDDSDDAEALDELEAEELEMLTDDEASETLIVNEEQELRAIRRAELSLDEEGTERLADEFQCQSCFLVLKTTQLADKRRKHCKDCAG